MKTSPSIRQPNAGSLEVLERITLPKNPRKVHSSPTAFKIPYVAATPVKAEREMVVEMLLNAGSRGVNIPTSTARYLVAQKGENYSAENQDYRKIYV
jgi:hypothetical protein